MISNKEKSRIQKEIVDLIIKPHGRLLLAPRIGKTRIAIMVIKKFKPGSILWVTPSAKLSKNDIPEQFAKWGAKRYLKKLTTVTYSSLHKVEGYYDLIILDEEQHLTKKNSANLIDGGLEYAAICSMTGTKTKHRDKLQLYEQLKLDILYELKINKAVDLGLLANYDVTVLMITPDKKKLKKYNSIQYLLRKNNVASFVFHGDYLKIFGELNGTLALREKASKYGGRLFAIDGKYETLGYFVISDEGKYSGKVKINEVQYKITGDKIHLPYPASLLINRKKSLGDSLLKEEVASSLLSVLSFRRKIIFCNSIPQAEKLWPEATYHSKTTDKKLKEFQSGDINTIAMVNAGGTGYTYLALDDLILVQCDSDRNGSTTQKLC